MSNWTSVLVGIAGSIAAVACSSADASTSAANLGASAIGAGPVSETIGPESSALGLRRRHPSSAFVRLANLTSDAPALDFCLRFHGADATAPFAMGPMLKGRGLSDGLSYPQLSDYVPLAPGSYDVRVVAAGASDCMTSLGGMPDQLDVPAFDAGSYATLVGVGSLGTELFALDVHMDDRDVAASTAKLRFVHASPAVPALDVGLGAGDSFAPVFTDVAFRSAGTGDGVDANGYRQVPPGSNTTLVVRLAARNFDLLTVPGFAVPDGAAVSIFSIGVAGSGGALLKSLLACVDGDGSSGSGSSCQIVP